MDEANRAAGPKTRTLELPKGAAPATRNHIPFHLGVPNCQVNSIVSRGELYSNPAGRT